MKTMKLTACSTFHGPEVRRDFRVPAEFGRFSRRCSNACDGKKDSKTGIQVHCGCGFPVNRTDWGSPSGFVVHAEWNRSSRRTPCNIVIVVEPDFQEEV